MAQFKNYDAARNVCSTSSTGALTIGDNVTGCQSIKAKMSSGDTAKFYFRKGSQWISFLGTFTSPDQLARTRIIDGSGGLATNVDFNVGAGEVGIDISAEDLDLLNTVETSLTSAATFDIGGVYALRVRASGTTGPVTSLGSVANKFKIVRWAGATLTCNTTSMFLIGLANAATRVTSDGDVGIYASDASGNWRELFFQPVAGYVGRLVALTVFTASGTWTKAANTTSVIAEVQAGGASAGGVAAVAGQCAATGGAGGGGYSRRRITAPGATETVTVGAGGVAVTAGNNNGNTGGASSFGSWCSASGGAGSIGGPAGASANGAAGVGGVGSGGDINIKGNAGVPGFAVFNTALMSGPGGGSQLGGGGAGTVSTGVGSAGGNYGGGGGGSVSNGTVAAQSAGAGAPGVVLVWEYA
jgi:hypothetical protein